MRAVISSILLLSGAQFCNMWSPENFCFISVTQLRNPMLADLLELESFSDRFPCRKLFSKISLDIISMDTAAKLQFYNLYYNYLKLNFGKYIFSHFNNAILNKYSKTSCYSLLASPYILPHKIKIYLDVLCF